MLYGNDSDIQIEQLDMSFLVLMFENWNVDNYVGKIKECTVMDMVVIMASI